MKRFFIQMTALALFIWGAPLYAGDSMVFNYFDNYPPYSWKEDRQMQGILIDIVDEAVGKRLGIAMTHNGYPWKRAQRMVRDGDADALITLCGTRTDWTESGKECVITLAVKIFVKAGHPSIPDLEKTKTLADLRSFRIIDYSGNSWAKKKLIDKNFQVELAPNREAIFPMLVKGRADINLSNHMTGRYFIKNRGLKGQIVELSPMIETVPFHLCVGKKSSYTKILPEFDEAVRQMKQDGAMQKIFDKYQ